MEETLGETLLEILTCIWDRICVLTSSLYLLTLRVQKENILRHVFAV